MASLTERFDPRAIEPDVRKFWGARSLPPVSGPLGPPNGPRIHQMFGTISPDEPSVALLQRAVLADVEARYLAQSGRRSSGRILLRTLSTAAPRLAPVELLQTAGVWIGGGRVEPIPVPADAPRLQAMLERLASLNLLVSREMPMRSCPRCRTPRTPEGILYQEEQGPAYLVRFPLSGTSPRTSLIVWTDALWKLLGTTATLVHPDIPYVTARYRRRGSEERIVVTRSSLDRLKAWLPGSDFEVEGEQRGADLEGRRYDHPLATESPVLAEPVEPAGSVHGSTEVTDSGTGIVALVPAHGASDAAVARTLGITGLPVLDPDLTLTKSLMHKYQGLPVDTAEAFVLRDLNESGYLFAQLTVHRGVPYCAVCGTALIWEAGRAWCLEPGRLPPERLDLFSRLLPNEPLPPSTETVPWPVSERGEALEESAPTLLECISCGRLAPVTASRACACGGARQRARRRLLAIFRESLTPWARESPLPAGEGVRLYVPDRRRVPALIHNLVAMEASDAHPGDVRLSIFPTLPSPEDVATVGATEPYDALRAALVGLGATPRGGMATLPDRRKHESRRLRKLWQVVRQLQLAMARDGYARARGSITLQLREALEEDRAFLSLFERMRIEVLRLYEAGAAAKAQVRLARFFDEDIRDGYLPLVRRRLDAPGLPAEKSAAYDVLVYVLPLWVELYAPIAPFTMEAVHRSLRGESESVFDRPFTPTQEVMLDPKAERAYRRWKSVTRVLNRARRHLGLPGQAPLDKIVLFIRDEKAAGEMRNAAATLARLTNVGTIEIASPNEPWEGKRVTAVPILPAIQRVFGADTARVVRLLAGLSGRRIQDGIQSRSLQVAVEGRPVQILPTMVEFIETLPEGVLPIPWELGELFVLVPPGARARTDDQPPALSPDGFRLLRLIRRRLRRQPSEAPLPPLSVLATGRLAEEVERNAAALARILKVPSILLVRSDDGFREGETVHGRSGRGERWVVWLPGVARPGTRRKSRPTKAAPSRIRRTRGLPTPESPVVDFLSEPILDREAHIDDWVGRLDTGLGRPFIGPSKLRFAWESGLHTFDDLIHAPFDRLAQVPGFGPLLAAEIVRHYGGEVPEGAMTTPMAALRLQFAVDRSPRPPMARSSTPLAPEPLPPPVAPAVSPVEPAPAGPSPLPPVAKPAAGPSLRDPPGLQRIPPSNAPRPPLTTRPARAEGAPSVPPPVVAPVDLAPAPLPPIKEAEVAPPPADPPLPPSTEALLASETSRTESPADSKIEVAVPMTPTLDLPEPLVPGVTEVPAAPPVPLESLSPATPAESATSTVDASVRAGAETTVPPTFTAESPSAPPSPTADLGGTGTAPSVSTPGPGSVVTPPAKTPAALPPRGPLPSGPGSPYWTPTAENVPTPPRPPSGLILGPGRVTNEAWNGFLDATSGGLRGLCLSREFPDRLRALLGPRDIAIVWVSNASRPGVVRAVDLEQMRTIVEEAVTQHGVRAIYVDSVEYLIRVNTMDRIVTFLKALRTVSTDAEARAWVPLNPLLLNPSDAERLVKEFPGQT